MSGELQSELQCIEATLGGGTLGVYAVTDKGETIAYNAEEVFPTASVIKAVIVAELFAQVAAGKLSLDETVTLTDADTVAGSGVLAGLNPGHTFTLGELARLAISVSDNTASNAVLRAVGGIERVNARMHDEWDMLDTVIHRPIQFHLAENDPPHTATGTPRDMGGFMSAVASGTLHSPDISAQLAALLATCDDTAMLPRYLEVNAFAGDLDTAAPPLVAYHKPGAVTGVRNDAGFVRHGDLPGYIAMAIYTKNVPDVRWTVANAGCEAVGRVAEQIVRNCLPLR